MASDFNIILDPSENFNGFQVVNTDIKDFKECVSNLSVTSHAFTRPQFTWSNHQRGGFLARKLDRVLVNDVWFIVFSHSLVEFLAPADSDHCLSLVQLFVKSDSLPKPFKIFNYWTRHLEFLMIVEDS